MLVLDVGLRHVRLRLQGGGGRLDGFAVESARGGFEIDRIARRRLDFGCIGAGFSATRADQPHTQAESACGRRHHEVKVPGPGELEDRLSGHDRFNASTGDEIAAAAHKRQLRRQRIEPRAAVLPQPQRDSGAAAVVLRRIGNVAHGAIKLYRDVGVVLALVSVNDLDERPVLQNRDRCGRRRRIEPGQSDQERERAQRLRLLEQTDTLRATNHLA